MINAIFKDRKANFAKLKNYGFFEFEGGYKFETSILNGQFKMCVTIDKNDKVLTKLIDSDSQDEYVLHLVEGSVGEFVGKVKAEFEAVLLDIRDNCFDKDIFKSEQAKQLIEYVRNKYNDELEFLWEKFDNNAIWRRKDNKKWYGLLVNLPKNKLGVESQENVDIVVLRIQPEEIENVIDNKTLFEGYHMNKKHWLTICLDGSATIEKIFNFIDNSFSLAK